MRRIIAYIFVAFGLAPVLAQQAFHNYGDIQMHNSVSVGFHLDLINNGSFDQNTGLVGFYKDFGQLTISGAFTPVFYDAEIAVDEGVVLETSISINNNGNLIIGDIMTPRNQSNIYSNFMDISFYTGESSLSKVDGYAAITNKERFVFPVGNDERLRTLGLESMAINALAK